MKRFFFLVVLATLLEIAGCAGEAGQRPEERPKPAEKEDARMELSETRPKPGPVQSWRPPPVWLVSGGEAVQASYGSFCELDVCIGADSPRRMGDELATTTIAPGEKVLLVVGGKGLDEISAGVLGWEHEPKGLAGFPMLEENGVPYGMKGLDLLERPKGEKPVVNLASGGQTVVSELASTGRKGDRLLSVFLKSHDGANSAAYYLRLDPGEEGDNPPPEEKEFPGSVAEVRPDSETEVHPPEEAARELNTSVESSPFGASATRIEAGEGYLWMLGTRGDPGTQYPREQDRPEGGAEGGVASGSLAAQAADKAAGPPGDTALLKVEPGTREVLFSASVPGSQGGVEVGADAAWAATEEGVTRLDPDTGEVVAEISVGGSPTQMASSRDGLWIALYDDVQSGRVVRVDPATNEVVAEIETPGIAESIAVDGETGDVWAVVLDQRQGHIDYENNQLVRIDPETDEISERLRVEGGISGVVAGGGEVWVSNVEARLSKVDPEGKRVASVVTLDPEQGPYSMEIGAGSLWAASVGTVWRVDLVSGRPMGSTGVVEYGTEDLAVDDEGNVWLTGTGILTRIAPR